VASPNTVPIYPGTIRSAVAKTSAANTGRDGSGTVVSLFTAGALGSLVSRVGVINGTAIGGGSTAGVARLFRTTGGVSQLIDEVALPTASPTASVVGTRVQFNRTNIQLISGESLSVATSVADPTDYEAEGGDY
jgi:hypothetical protein